MSESENKPLLKHQIYLVRHGEVDVPAGVCYGQLDCAVSKGFELECHRLINYFTTPSFLEIVASNAPLIISSPLTRCNQLAQALKETLDSQTDKESNIKIEINNALKEIDFGDWEGRTWQSIGQKQIDHWNNDLLDYTFPNGESARRFDQRVIDAWNELITQLTAETMSKTVILVVHAGVIRSILSRFLHIPLQHSLLLNIDKLSVSRLNLFPQYETLSRCMFVNKKL